MGERTLELTILISLAVAAFVLMRFVFRDRLNQFYANNRRGRLIAGVVAGIVGVIVYQLVQSLVR